MRILWLINISLPETSLLMNEKTSPSGGWLVHTSKKIADESNIKLGILFPSKKSNKIKYLKGEKIDYFSFKKNRNNNKQNLDNYFTQIIKKFSPDVVHIFGTELMHSLVMVNVCNRLNIKFVISAQGLVSAIKEHMYSGLPCRVIYRKTLRNIIRRDNVSGLKKMFTKSSIDEKDAIKNTKYIIGRTTFDRAVITQINPNIHYFHCDEVLREGFYRNKWNIESIEKYSIFMSQGNYPIKGIHFLIEALPTVLKKFPDAKVYVSGKNITKKNSLKDKLLMTYYGKYIIQLLEKYRLSDKIIFTGPLNEKQMIDRYLKSHVFVSPSTIENSSNSLSEAKILGVPSVASYVGGVTDLIEHSVDGYLYQHDAPYMLAYFINKIFSSDKLAVELSKNAREKALRTHNINDNIKCILDVYNIILDNKINY